MNPLRLPDRLMGKVAVGAIHLYQRFISHDYNGENHARCMYTPSCSRFAEEALGQEGLVGGLLDTFMRLNRCVPEVGTRRMTEFAQTLARAPAEKLDETFECTGGGARKRLGQAHSRLLEAVELGRSGTPAQAQKMREEITAFFHDELHVAIEDHPGRLWQTPHFVVGTESPPVEPKLPERGALRTALNVAASAVGGAVGVAVGALGLGVATGIAGAVMGTFAGAGRTEPMNQWIARRYGTDSVIGLAGLERSVGGPGYRVHRWLSQRAGEGRFSAAAGVAAGLPAGLGIGFWTGARQGLEVGWHAGKVFGHNLADRGVQKLVDWWQEPAGSPST